MSTSPIVVIFSGKRKSGKDFCSSLLRDKLFYCYNAQIVGVSHSLKAEYAKLNDLDYSKLISDGPYKEKYRKEMIVWGEEIRERDPAHFCSFEYPLAAMSSCPSAEVVIVTDCRRPTDVQFFSDNYRTISVRVESPVKVREARGFKFVAGIDDADSECALDDWKFDFAVNNDGVSDLHRELSPIQRRIEDLACQD